jgi:aspartyl/asparaginyl-tRNA synthetase
MIEPEMSFATLADDAQLAEDFLRYIFRFVLERCREDLEFFNEWVDKTTIARLESLAAEPFLRMTYTEAVAILEKSGRKFEFPVAWGKDLQSEHERYLTEVHLKRPVILTDYPREIKAFYMKLNDDGKTVRAMDVLVPGVGEIIGGSEREDRADVLGERMREFGLEPEHYQWYLDFRSARGLWPGPRTTCAVYHRHGEYSRCCGLSAHAGSRKILRSKRSARRQKAAHPTCRIPGAALVYAIVFCRPPAPGLTGCVAQYTV